MSAGGDTIDFEDGWERVKTQGILKILEQLRKNPDGEILSTTEKSKLYTLVYQMCTQDLPYNWSRKLYYAIIEEFREICEQIRDIRIGNATGSELVKLFVSEWNLHLRLLKNAQSFFGYIDRFFVERLALLKIRGAGIEAFRIYVFEPLKEKLTPALLDYIAQDRKSQLSSTDQLLVKTAIGVYIEVGAKSLDIYTKDWEEPFIAGTETYLKSEATVWLRESTCAQYLYRTRSQMRAENSRIDLYMHDDTRHKIIKVCERILIGEHVEEIIHMPNSGCKFLLETDDNEVLTTMFLLMKRVPHGLTPMAQVFRLYVEGLGAQLMQNPRYENQWNNQLESTLIADLVNMHQKYRSVLQKCFSEHNTFHRALKDGFENFMNKPLPQVVSANDTKRHRNQSVAITIAELLSDYIDRMLRKKPEVMIMPTPRPGEPSSALMTPRSEVSLEKNLSQTMEIFPYVNDKDVFSQFYRNHLAKRLILGRSSSNDAESLVIGVLKQICGAPFVSRFSGMLKDLMMAQTIQQEFDIYKQQEQDASLKRTDLRVKSLTSGFWPSYKEEKIGTLPPCIESSIKLFTNFYATRTAHRNLTWIHSLGSVVLDTTMKDGSHVDIIVNTIQGCILLLFNEPIKSSSKTSVQMTLKDICDSMGISESAVSKHLMPLVKGKYPLIKETDSSKGEKEYSFDWTYKSKSRRIRIPMLPVIKSKEAEEDRAQNMTRVADERKHAIEASIVRIMKSRSRLTYPELSSLVIEALAKYFDPNPKLIRQRVDDLIDRDFLEPDESDANVLLYVA